MRRTVLVACLLSGMLLGSCGLALGQDPVPPLFPLSSLADLYAYPNALPSERAPDLYVTALPVGELVVVLRPISESEYGSFQVQAIGYQMIEQEMLAAAIALPFVTPADVAGFSKELSDFLKRRVNEISGFAVFDVRPPSSP